MNKKEIAFKIGMVLAVLAVLTVSTVPAVNATATAYFVPQHSNASEGGYEWVYLYIDIPAGEHLAGGQIQLNFDPAHANITYSTKACPAAAEGEHCWEGWSKNHNFVGDGYWWGGMDGPQEAVYNGFEGIWEWNTIQMFEGPMLVRFGKFRVEPQGTPGESPFDFGFEMFPEKCYLCQRSKLVKELGVEIDVIWINGTFTYLGEEKPDLIVSEITPNCGYLFGNESNGICAKIENIGDSAAGPFSVSFVVDDGFSEEVTVTGLAADANTTVCVTDTTERNAGDSVTVTVTADCNAEVDESDETNNASALDITVVNNGYKGKRYTGGEDITTWKTFELKGNLVYSVGDSYYLSGYAYWTMYNVHWTASDLPVSGTVKDARLYAIYTWDKHDVMPDNVSMSFNGVGQEPEDAHYMDRKMYDGWNLPYGMLAYNVTEDFNAGGNYANLTKSESSTQVSMRGMLLVVIYEDASEPRRQIYVNEEFDLLYGGSGKCTTPEEATAYAPFGAIDPCGVEKATLITVAPGAGPNEGELIFNGQTWTNVWNFAGNSQIGIDERDVTSCLQSTDNLVGFQSSGDYMEASNAFLVVKAETTPPDISVTVSPNTLWPPNHKMVDIVATVTVSDDCDPNPVVILANVTSSEPDDAQGKPWDKEDGTSGDGNTANDIQGADIDTEDYEFQLRAERAGKGDGRVYTITYTATDASGNSASASATVTVPLDIGS